MLHPLLAMCNPSGCLSADENLEVWMWTDFHNNVNNVTQADKSYSATFHRRASCNIGMTLLRMCRKWGG